MKVTMMLADVVRVAEGKLDALGAGWTIHNLGAPWALGIIIEVPWAQIGQEHTFRIVLTDDKGTIAVGPSGEALFDMNGTFKGDRQPGVLLGSAQTMPVALTMPPLPLTPNERYRLVLTIDELANLDWDVAFTVVDPRPNVRAG